MDMFILRYVIGGAIVAGIPIIARLFGPYVAGMIVLVPATSALAAYFLGKDQGGPAVERMAYGSLVGLLALAAFFLCLAQTAVRLPVLLAIGISLLVWMGGIALLRSGLLSWQVLAGALVAVLCAQKLIKSPQDAFIAVTVLIMGASIVVGFVLWAHNPVFGPPVIFLPVMALVVWAVSGDRGRWLDEKLQRQ